MFKKGLSFSLICWINLPLYVIYRVVKEVITREYESEYELRFTRGGLIIRHGLLKE